MTLIDAFDDLWQHTRPAFEQERTWRRTRTLALSALVGLGRHTITGLLAAGAQQFGDWTAAYRLFEQERFDLDALFAPIRRAVVDRMAVDDPLVIAMDDTLVRKRGRTVHGAAWQRDPLGPPFATNLVWSQRFVQLSAMVPETSEASRARAIPVDFTHAPLPTKPRKTATAQEWETYRRLQQTMKLSAVGVQRLHRVRAHLDTDTTEGSRRVIVAVDGAFTNRTVFRNLPHDTVAIGRLRKDARLFHPPPMTTMPKRGRPRWFGECLLTPEQIRQDGSIPWMEIPAFGAGKVHHFQVKTLAPVRWLGTGNQDVRLVVIRPLAYRPRKHARLLYRNPAYLICTDPDLPVDRLLQAYLWRWEIEVNFRDEKTLLGVGEAQVRTATAAATVPALIVAAYAFMLVATTAVAGTQAMLPLPKWRHQGAGQRTSTAQWIGLMRAQLWGKGMGVNLTHFVNRTTNNTNPDLIANALPSAVFYAFR